MRYLPDLIRVNWRTARNISHGVLANDVDSAPQRDQSLPYGIDLIIPFHRYREDSVRPCWNTQNRESLSARKWDPTNNPNGRKWPQWTQQKKNVTWWHQTPKLVVPRNAERNPKNKRILLCQSYQRERSFDLLGSWPLLRHVVDWDGTGGNDLWADFSIRCSNARENSEK